MQRDFIEVQTEEGRFLFVPVPESYSARVAIADGQLIVNPRDGAPMTQALPAPADKWELIATVGGALQNPSTAAAIVESRSFNDTGDHGLGRTTYYRNYPDDIENSTIFNACESFETLMYAYGIDRNSIILKETAE